MKVSCDIIQDILPLYAEDMVSNATRELVDEHLCECDGCMKELAALKKAPKVPMDINTETLERISHGIRNRRIVAILCLLLTLFSTVVTVCQFMTTEIYLTADQAIEDVYLREDGGLVIDYARGITGSGGIGRPDGMCYMMCRTTRYDWLRGKILDKKLETMTEEEIEDYVRELYAPMQNELPENWEDRFYGRLVQYNFVNEDGRNLVSHDRELHETYLEVYEWEEGSYAMGEHNYNIAYLEPDGSVKTVLWQGGEEDPTQFKDKYPTGLIMWPVSFFGSLIGTVALGIWLHFHKNGKHREWLVRLALLLGSVAFGIFVVSNGDFCYARLHDSAYGWMHDVKLNIPLVFLTALVWRRRYVMKQCEKAI